MESKICLVCGKEYSKRENERYNSFKKRKYCCKECYWKSLKEKEPWNKGTKGIMKPNKTSFKKGRVCWNKGKLAIWATGENNHLWKGGISNYYTRKNAPRKKPKVCEICGRDGIICYDHDHETGEFRGWICTQCNIILGMAKDDKDILYKIIEYIKANEKNNTNKI